MSINRSIANLLGSVTGTGTEPTLTIGDGTAEDTKIVFDGHAQDYYIGLDDTDDDFKIGLGSTVGTTPHIVIDETGAVTKPLQPAFLAKTETNVSNVTGDGTYYTGIFGGERFDQNADFNGGTGTFTAPVTGRYYLHTFVYSYDMQTNHTTWNLQLVTSNVTYQGTRYVSTTSDPTEYAAQFGFLVDMDAADTATVTLQVSGGSQVVEWASNSHFGGWLVA